MIQIELTEVEGAFPDSVFEPTQTVPADNGSTWMMLGPRNRQMAGLHFTSNTSRGLQVNLLPYCQFPNQATPVRFLPDVIKMQALRGQVALRQLGAAPVSKKGKRSKKI